MKRIETPRLILRRLNTLDSQDIFSLMSDTATAWWADILPITDEAEAVEAVCRELFSEPYVREIILEILPDNAASRGVARRVGFTLLGVEPWAKPCGSLDGKPLDTFIITREALRAAIVA